MAKIRSIKPELFSSPSLANCSIKARLTFLGLLVFSDDRGVHQASLLRAKMEIFPADAITLEEINTWISELIDVGLITIFEANGERYWHIVNFIKHQKVKNPYFRFPEPPSYGINTISHGNKEQFCLLKIGDEPDLDQIQTQSKSDLDLPQTSFEPDLNRHGNGNVNGDDNGNGNGINTCEVKTSPSLVKSANSEASQHASDDVEAIFLYWRQVMNYPRAKLDKRRQVKIKQALDMGYMIDELKQAIDGCSLTPFNMGQNDRGQKYDSLDLILRDAEHIDRFMANAVDPPTDGKTSTENFDLMVGVL